MGSADQSRLSGLRGAAEELSAHSQRFADLVGEMIRCRDVGEWRQLDRLNERLQAEAQAAMITTARIAEVAAKPFQRPVTRKVPRRAAS